MSRTLDEKYELNYEIRIWRLIQKINSIQEEVNVFYNIKNILYCFHTFHSLDQILQSNVSNINGKEPLVVYN